MWLNGKIRCNDLAGYYKPLKSNNTGCIDYPLSNLPVGSHRVTVKVFDNAGNGSEITIGMTVLDAQAPLYELDIEEDPVVDQATINLTGEVTDEMNIRYVIAEKNSGKEVWSSSTTATTVKATGIARGEYIVYAVISNKNGHFHTANKKIIVLGQ